MRKKYLSALLFGALLFASAGTFTSCKDYDDDINNLSQRIDQVASDLSDLKTKVDALGGYVENVSFADGVLSVTTGGNTVTYNIPDKTGVNEVTLALEGNNLVLTVDGTATTIELPAGESGETPEIPEIEVIDGVLYINGEAQDLKVDVESNVTIIESTIPGNETYTVMVNGEEVTFAKAFADVRISLETINDADGNFYFTDAKFANSTTSGNPSSKQENGIHWAIASSDIAWDGPKGNIKAGMVVGQVTAAEVSVRPINYDLTTAKLTLVSSKGVEAPVTVIATPGQKQGPLANGTRSADVNYSGVEQGDYVLSLQFDPTMTDEEMVSAFANATQTGNIKYALAVDGVVATDYKFIIDTQLKADAQSACETPDGSKLVIGGEGNWMGTVLQNIPADGLAHRMTYLDGRIYDMKVEINAKDVNDAEVYGVEISEDGTTIKAGENAIGRTFALDVTLIDVNGNISKTETIQIKFAEAEQQEITLSPVTYNVTPDADKSVLVDLGDVFSSLTAGDAIAINSLSNITWAIENEDPTFLWYYDNGIPGVQNNEFDYLNYGRVSSDATGYNRIMYYDENMNGIDVSDDKMDENVKKIRYARLVWNGVDYANPRATDGEHLISITINRNISASDLSGAPTRLVKKVNIPVHVVVPAWEDLFKTTSQWNGNTYITRLTNVTSTQAQISMDAFQDASTAWGNSLNDAIAITKLKYATPDGRDADAYTGSLPTTVGGFGAQLVSLDYAALTDDIASTHKLAFTEMSAKAEYVIGGVADFTIEKEFNVQLKTIFEDAKLVYYVWNGSAWVAAANAKMNASDIIVKGIVDADNETITNEGLVLELNGYKHRIASAFFDGTRSIALKANNITGGEFDIKYSNSSMSNESDINIWKLDAQAGGLNVIVDRAEQDGVKVTSATSIDSGTSGSVTLYFEDIMGVQTEASINFVKQ